jgi:hypothetical protein
MVDPAVYRRRRLTALGAGAGVVVVAILLVRGCGSEDRPAVADRLAKPLVVNLPRGGRQIFPRYRVVAYYGAPQDKQLGALGIGSPAQMTKKLERQAKPYDRKTRPILPAMELIAVVAAAHPGDGGRYNLRQPDSVIRRYLKAARKAKALLILDIQPGRSDFFTETTRLERWLREPDVGLALDPEWRVGEGEVPGQVIGQVGAREVNATSAWLAQLVARESLPQKLFVVHQFTDGMVDDTELKRRDGLAMVLNTDGFGSKPIKVAKYHAFTRAAKSFDQGLKLFYEEDAGLMSPREVLRLRPAPDVVVYE